MKCTAITKALCVTCILYFVLADVTAQEKYDSIIYSADSVKTKVMVYPVDGQSLVYKKPKPFSFITQLPRTFGNAAKESFNKKSIPAWSVIVGSTLLLLTADQSITNGMNQFSNYVGVDPARRYKDVVQFKLGSMEVNAYQAPQNLNSVLYSIGEGSTSVLLCAGLFTYGKIKNDYRALQTSSQLMQTLLAVGITCQTFKRISGRESPFSSTASGGRWRPFPNLKTYQEHVSHYDAFPSGHLATMMATVTVVKDNYPEKKWIGPVGYGLITVVGMAMINNGVHWASDYPLALGIGYVFGKVTVKMNRWIRNEK